MNTGSLREFPVAVHVRSQWVSWRGFLPSAEWWTPAVWVERARPGPLSGKRMCSGVVLTPGRGRTVYDA